MAASYQNRLSDFEPSGMFPAEKRNGMRSQSQVVQNFVFSTNQSSKACSPKKTTIFVDCSSSDDDDDDEEKKMDYSESFGNGKAEVEPSILDPRDQGTADSWIKRNPCLVRLTGKHPFNSEPPLDQLMRHGFITPAPIHYVRNHGLVPNASWQDWTVEVCGLVKRPTLFTMDQLVNEFTSREFPVTLVCAGNRRKEQNMVKKTIGFNWGAAGISTSVWRGVPLVDVLKRCGIYSRNKGGALNVCFEGAEDLPGGGGSKYGTSIKREFAMDRSRDIILAYMQNGERLMPDHGFPVRMIIPGFIGGRMVKWLKRIVVTTRESDNYYHYRDNRVLPSHVDAELANAQAWWYKPEYIINELNINSVITTPSHGEVLAVNSVTTRRPYILKGYAYSGGGKKVTRVEVTLDGGESWLVCKVDHPEKPNKYGKYWCWCFWSTPVEVVDLLNSKDIAVRAWDETLNTQPESLIWNLMGMMNNCWFRVKTKVCKQSNGEIGISFEHPTQPGNQTGGWMAPPEKPSEPDPSPVKNLSSSDMKAKSMTYYSLSEVESHNNADSPWIIVHGLVYDCTPFLKDHPGGSDSILINAGTDCTEEFDAIHSDKAKKMLADYLIGELESVNTKSSPPTTVKENKAVKAPQPTSERASLVITKEIALPQRKVALVPQKKIPCKMVSKKSISHDSRLFRFALPSEDQVLGLPVGKHIFLCAYIDDKLCMRAYTPSSSVDIIGYFELVIKVYFKGVMTQYLDSLPIGATVDVKGPVGHIEYKGNGNFIVHSQRRFAKKLAMLAGGTGITPIYQVMQAILKNPNDDTTMFLVYANRTEDDILLKDELDEWVAKHRNRLKIWYVVGRSITEGWKYSVGHIDESIMKNNLPEASNDVLALACGPPAMIQSTIIPNLEKMGYDAKNCLLVF